MAGPFKESGGLARVSRMTVDGFDTTGFDVVACDTAKDTPTDRNVIAACVSHLRRWIRFVRIIRAHKPHVVHIHTCSYNTFYRTILDAATCRLLRRPYILHIHGGLFAEFLASLSGFKRWIVADVLRRAARVVVLGNVWRTKLSQQMAGLKLVVIPNAVEPVPLGSEDDSHDGGLLFVGDLSEIKRPEDLLVAYAALPSPMRNSHPLTLVGDGDATRRRRLIALTERLGVVDNVRFEGSQPHEVVQSLMRHANLLILPSRAEGMPLALLEAMQASLPAVATRVGAIPEMVIDGVEAALVEPFDTVALAHRMKQLLGDKPLCRRMGLAARQRVEKEFSADRFRSSIAALWIETAPVSIRAAATPKPKLASFLFRSFL